MRDALISVIVFVAIIGSLGALLLYGKWYAVGGYVAGFLVWEMSYFADTGQFWFFSRD